MIATPLCVKTVLDCLDPAQPGLEYQLLKTLSKLRNRESGLVFPAERVRAVLRRATCSYWEFVQIQALLPANEGEGTALLSRAVGEKCEENLKRIFRLLALIHPAQDLYNAYLGYVSGNRADGGSAIEFLENVLPRAEREVIVPLLDATTPGLAVEAGSRHFGTPLADFDQAVAHILQGPDPWLRACVTYSLAENSTPATRAWLAQLAEDADPLVRETAMAVVIRTG